MKTKILFSLFAIIAVSVTQSCHKDKCLSTENNCNNQHFGVFRFKTEREYGIYNIGIFDTLPLNWVNGRKSLHLTVAPQLHHYDSIIADTISSKCYWIEVYYWEYYPSSVLDSYFVLTSCVTDCDTTEIVFK